MSDTNLSPQTIEVLKQTPPFDMLTDELWNTLLPTLRLRTYDPGIYILKQRKTKHKYLYIVIKGSVRLIDNTTHSLGTECEPGHIFGAVGLIEGGPLPYGALATDTTECLLLPAQTFHELCEKDELFAQAFETNLETNHDLPSIEGWVGGVQGSPFTFIHQVQGSTPWGSMLDAGTGQSSLGWITQLETSHWTAITKDEPRADTLKAVYADKIREQDRIIIGDWRDSELCKDEVYDTVLADYLLGAIERFAPHFQDQLFERLRPHVGKRLYFIGIEPILEPAPTIGGQIIQEIHRLRDLCATMSYEHPYREYPLQWVLRNLPRAGFQIEGFQTFPKLFGLRYFHDMLDGCVQALPKFRDAELAASVAKAIARYRKEALSTSYLHFGVQISKDYVVVAKPV